MQKEGYDVDATDRFLDKLVDVEEPETKRKVIGAEFIRVFEEETRKVGNEVSFLAQGFWTCGNNPRSRLPERRFRADETELKSRAQFKPS